MTYASLQNRWRAALSAALWGAVAALITIGSPAKLYAQAPAGALAGGGRGGGQSAVPPAEALFTSAQAVAGKTAYQRNCASCHGAAVDDGSSAPPLRGPAFLG
jgi:mono/diheme cytochrome c family protein